MSPTLPLTHRPTADTLIELLAVMFVVAMTGLVEEFVAHRFGRWTGIGTGAVTLIICIMGVVLFYRWSWKRDRRRLQELREKYRGIYRVLALPSNQKIVAKPDGAEIRIGDYGWEAGPVSKDGLIYLQGLTVEWTVVWHAGFRPDQIEWITEQPSSQYDYWVPYWAKSPPPPACPYPVLERNTLPMGRPHHSHRYLVIPSPYPSKGSGLASTRNSNLSRVPSFPPTKLLRRQPAVS